MRCESNLRLEIVALETRDLNELAASSRSAG
jgi:hypothetical protein